VPTLLGPGLRACRSKEKGKPPAGVSISTGETRDKEVRRGHLMRRCSLPKRYARMKARDSPRRRIPIRKKRNPLEEVATGGN
jgi:hypothetical protein